MSTASAAANPPRPAEPATPTLAYADLPSRWGITVEHLPDGVRVVVPPVPSWRRLHTGFFVGGTVLALFVALGAFMAWQTRDWAPLVANGTIYGGGLLWVILAARHRLRRRVVLEVTGRTVARTYLSGRGAGHRVDWAPRQGQRDQVQFLEREADHSRHRRRVRRGLPRAEP
jgi:hypothetical protein